MRGARARACAPFGTTPARVRVAHLQARAGCLQLRDRRLLFSFWCTGTHRIHAVAAAGSSPPPRAPSTAQRVAAKSTVRSTRSRGVQKSNRHTRAHEERMSSRSGEGRAHLTVERGRRRASCEGFWRRAAARRHAHLLSLGSAAPSERLSEQIALVGGTRRSCARRHRLLAARRRARHSIASRPILLASFVHAFSLALAGRSAQSRMAVRTVDLGCLRPAWLAACRPPVAAA